MECHASRASTRPLGLIESKSVVELRRLNCSLAQNRIDSFKLAARVGEVSSKLTDIETPGRHRQVSRAKSPVLDKKSVHHPEMKSSFHD